ncbi:hypothetical protein K503DRAFT_775287, partial [Rhizopogon vinicolor AM-OR11-026]
VLQWGTVGGAVIAAYFTPTTGIGCRSLSYLLYGGMSTFIWIILMISSFLAHYSAGHSHQDNVFLPARVARTLSDWLRRIGKLLAFVNSIWVIALCALQYSNFYDTCYCDSSVIGRGDTAYTVIIESAAQIAQTEAAWLGTVVFAITTASLFLGLMSLLSDTLP